MAQTKESGRPRINIKDGGIGLNEVKGNDSRFVERRGSSSLIGLSKGNSLCNESMQRTSDTKVEVLCSPDLRKNSDTNCRKLSDDTETLDYKKLSRALLAEAVGIFIIVIFGVGSVNTAVTTGAQAGLWQVAVVWGFGVTLAILCTAEASGAHLNPAVTLAFFLVRREESFGSDLRNACVKASLYVVAQMIGAIIGGIVNLGMFGETIAAFERNNKIERGANGSERSAMVFGEYYPNPGFSGSPFKAGDVSTFQAMCIEAWGTCILCFVIFMLTHPRNPILGGSSRPMVPYFIGFTVASLISLYAPLTQAGWNPARDFGPRIVAAAAGWGRIAIPGPRGGFWVYIIGPFIGGPIGAYLAEIFAFISIPEADERYKDQMTINVENMSQPKELTTIVEGESDNSSPQK